MKVEQCLSENGSRSVKVEQSLSENGSRTVKVETVFIRVCK